jgi:hypothetical protein
MNRPHFSISGRSGANFAEQLRSQSEATWSSRGLTSSSQPPATAIENLRLLMSRDVPISADRIAALRDRVSRGEFFTREAAEATASRLLDDNFDID